MNKYTELSDFEINKRVAYLFLDEGCYEINSYRQEVMYFRSGSGKGLCRDYDPCNNPADAMPIIVENKIAMNHPYDIWQCGSGWNVAENKNPLRACMEAYLMKKDAENEG